jgi:hypothetical protein
MIRGNQVCVHVRDTSNNAIKLISKIRKRVNKNRRNEVCIRKNDCI